MSTGFRIDFKQLAASLNIEQVVKLLDLTLKKTQNELRGPCPACNADNPRTLAVYPHTKSFRCYSAEESGDVIALYAHIKGIRMFAAAKELQEYFGQAEESPQPKPQAAAQKPKEKHSFDADAFAQKLAYSDEVKALGISEEDAARLGIGQMHSGYHRGRVCFPIRDAQGVLMGYIGWNGEDLKMPPKWEEPKVLTFKRRA